MVFQVSLVLLAFAANSLLCRWALDVHQFDPAVFSLVRLLSGAVTLTLLPVLTRKQQTSSISSRLNLRSQLQQPRFWYLGLGLGTYVLGFSWAYTQLDTGVGAFILFATVQLAMQIAGFIQGGRLTWLQWAGVVISLLGLAGLLLPGGSAPEPLAAVLMFIAALGWTTFVLMAKASGNALEDVQQAFVAASLLLIPLFPLLLEEWLHWSPMPWLLALLSGSVASGLGYFLWYRILPQLGVHRAAQYQLLVPVIAVVMGMVVLQEAVAVESFVAMAVIIAGVVLSTFVKKPA